MLRTPLIGDVLPEDRDAIGKWTDSDLQHTWTSAAGKSDMRQHARGSIGQRIVNRSRDLCRAQSREHVGERATDRSFLRTADDAFENIAPQRDQTSTVKDRDALVDRVDDLATPMLVFEPTVYPVSEEQRHGQHRQGAPHPSIDQLDEPYSDGRPDQQERREMHGERPSECLDTSSHKTLQSKTVSTPTIADKVPRAS